MIYLLDFILIVNFICSYRYFRNLMAPPILLGSSMLIASLVATSYYTEWEMNLMLKESVIALGGGTCFFTFCCILIDKLSYSPKIKEKADLNLKFIKTINFYKFYILTIAIGIIGILLKIHFMIIQFGALSLPKLILAKRQDEWNQDNLFQLPSYIRQIGSYTQITSYLSIWLFITLSIKGTPQSKLKKILLLQLVVTFFDGILSGSKAPTLNMITIFIIFYLYRHYATQGNFQLSKRIIIQIISIIFIVILSFKGLSLLIGRNIEERSNIDLFAEYCGAEIKNFDIYLNNKTKTKTNKWGENTFYSFYSEIDPKFTKDNGEFQNVGGYSLGNVYTQYRSFHEDWGYCGIIGMDLFIALISMFFYRKSLSSFINPLRPNVFLFIYSSMILSIFMGFFSSKFTESLCNLGWIRTCIYITILTWFTKKYLILKINH